MVLVVYSHNFFWFTVGLRYGVTTLMHTQLIESG